MSLRVFEKQSQYTGDCFSKTRNDMGIYGTITVRTSPLNFSSASMA